MPKIQVSSVLLLYAEEQQEYAVADDSNNELNGNKNGRLQGARYTGTEDLLICKAFISASKDSQVGTSQKGKVFASKMLKIDSDLFDEEERYEVQRLFLGDRNTDVTGTVYDRINKTAIHLKPGVDVFCLKLDG